MQRMLVVFVLSLLLVTTGHAQLLLYPTGMINSRLPVIPTREGGSVGKVFPAQGVRLRYDFAGQLGQMTTGQITLDFRVIPGRREALPIVIGDGHQAIGVALKPASEGRFFVLQRMDYSYADLKFTGSKVHQKIMTQTAPSLDWQKLQLSWDDKAVTLQYAGKTVATLPITSPMSFTELYVDGWCVDELSLTGQNILMLDWEKDYAARIDVTSPTSEKQMQATLLGFDNFVVNTDPQARDFPMLQVNNPTATAQKITAAFDVKRELTGQPWQWQQTVEVPAKQSKLVAVAFPQSLGSDVFHLQMKVKNGDDVLATDTRHFMHTPRRDEPAGPKKFGLHDCNVRVFGFWPEALPIDLAHHYLRWGYVQGPGWVKDWDSKYGLDPAIPAEQWYWNDRIDWAIDQGREMFVCVQSTPFSDWAREHPYKHMRKYSWGNVGGHPKIDLYRNFLKEAAKRYTGKVDYWEVENEPNASSHIPFERFDDYVQVCKAVYEELKSADPKTKIFGISGTSKFQPWMDKVLGNGGNQYLDGVSWHTYTSPNTPDEIGFPKIIKESVDIVKKHMPNAPIFNSETGVVSVMRYDVDKAIDPKIVTQKVRENNKAFVANSWMGAAFDEWHGGACIVTNAVYNFLGGVEKYVFFGWNPQWPGKTDWEKHSPDFSLFSVAADGTRTPSLMTLSVANLTTQMQGVLLDDSQRIELTGVNGGLFNKANGGKLAILWAPSGKESVMFKTDARLLEIVDLLGQTRILNVAQGVAVCDVTELPMYVHVRSKQLSIEAGPVEKVLVKADGPVSGQCEITLHNPLAQTLDGTFAVQWQAGQGNITPASQALSLKPGQSKVVNFGYQLDTDESKTVDKPALSLKVTSKSATNALPIVFHSSVAIPTRPVATVKLASSPVRLHQSHDAMLTAMKSADATAMKLNRLEQVKLGRPPALASLNDPAWWGGEDELSADIHVAADDKALVLFMDVTDVAAREPRTWPSVKGSVIELFFDLRQPGEGLGDPVYGSQTLQVLVKPQLTVDVAEAQVWSPQRERLNVTCFSQYDAKSKRYWFVYRMPWEGHVPETIGFDVAINAAPLDGPGRKTQMLLFGDASNARNASAFGQLVIKP